MDEYMSAAKMEWINAMCNWDNHKWLKQPFFSYSDMYAPIVVTFTFHPQVCAMCDYIKLLIAPQSHNQELPSWLYINATCTLGP